MQIQPQNAPLNFIYFPVWATKNLSMHWKGDKKNDHFSKICYIQGNAANFLTNHFKLEYDKNHSYWKHHLYFCYEVILLCIPSILLLQYLFTLECLQGLYACPLIKIWSVQIQVCLSYRLKLFSASILSIPNLFELCHGPIESWRY